MGVNNYFNNFNNENEQNLLESLVMESIKIYGHNIIYSPRRYKNIDEIFGEDRSSYYDKAFEIEMYIKSYDAYEGDGQFLSKFNMEIRDQMTFTVAIKSFKKEVTQLEPELKKPLEGDLLYVPMSGRIFKIMYVKPTTVFYQLGKLNTYDLVCELFEYDNEHFTTGIPEIDRLEPEYSLSDVYDLNTQTDDILSDNIEIQLEANNLLIFTEQDPFSEGIF